VAVVIDYCRYDFSAVHQILGRMETTAKLGILERTKISPRELKMENPRQTISIQTNYVLVERPPGYEVILSEQAQVLLELSTACNKAGCKKVLILGPRTKMSLSAFDILELGAGIAKLDVQMAIVELSDASDDAVSLLESAALNRGGEVKFFDNVNVAKDWLGIPDELKAEIRGTSN
jgi:hypothetical protein